MVLCISWFVSHLIHRVKIFMNKLWQSFQRSTGINHGNRDGSREDGGNIFPSLPLKSQYYLRQTQTFMLNLSKMCLKCQKSCKNNSIDYKMIF